MRAVMKIEDHKKAKLRAKGKDVKMNYDLKRDRERAALESVGLRHRMEALANAAAAAPAAPAKPRRLKRPRKMAAE
jgi:hypothetical protein